MKKESFYKKQVLKDIEAEARVIKIHKDKARLKRLRDFASANPVVVHNIVINISIENVEEMELCKS